MKNQGLFWIIAAVAVIALLTGGGETAPSNGSGSGSGGSGIDLSQLVSPTISFTGQNKFITSTALTSEYVRVMERNGLVNDFGQKSLNSGTLAVEPGKAYKLYWGENSSTYYTEVEDYTGHSTDNVQPKTVALCTIDTSPTITVYDENGQVQSSSANAQALGASEVVTVGVKLKATADKCYGNPDAPGTNAVCFDYNSTVFKKISMPGKTAITAPYSVSSAKAAGMAEACFPVDKVADTGSSTFDLTLEAQSSQPTNAHNITGTFEDVAFDLDGDNLDEIWGFQDEVNNNLGDTSANTFTIYVS